MTGPADEARQKTGDALLALYRARPQAIAAAIVRSEGEAQPHLAEVEAAGITVRRVFRLVPALAVEGVVADLLALAELQWVASISLDRELHTMGSCPPDEAVRPPPEAGDAAAAESSEKPDPESEQ
ncbi:MAG TPA: hypothetical protein VM537_22295 [Anaerolineae bacterium]|jgi:hypothetical protein|nr:hypothetical protein [Anaerolineae bacterium]